MHKENHSSQLHFVIMHWIITCILVGISLQSAQAQPDPDICIPGPGDAKGHELPPLPEQYKLRVDAYIANKNYTTVNIEYYDNINNRGAIEIYHIGNNTQNRTNERVFYDYDDEQYYVVYPNNTCETKKLTNHSFSFFGYHSEGGKGHINSAKDVFKFGEAFNETYMGQTTVDYFKVDWWRACVYIERYNLTYSLDFYFSCTEDTPAEQTIPIRVVMNGTGPLHLNATGKPGRRQFNHIYTFKDVQIGPQPDNAFWPPIGVVCPGRVSHKDVPQMQRNHFGLTVESVNLDNKIVHYGKEYYNFEMKLVAYENGPWNNHGDHHGDHDHGDHDHDDHHGGWNYQAVREIHDYNTGLAYRITAPEICEVTPISVYSRDSHSHDEEHVVMRSAANFFAIDANDVEWVYEGKTVHRDVTLDVWQTQRSHWKPYIYRTNETIMVNSAWEYSYAMDGWTMDGRQTEEKENKLPMRLEIHWVAHDTEQKKQVAAGTEIHNFFHHAEAVPDYFHFDVCQCYSKMDESLHLAFNLEGKDTYNKYVVNNHDHFYRGMINSLASSIGVSPTRISHPNVVNGFHNLSTVFFTLLDKPQVVGNAINLTDPGPSLNTAYSNLQLLVNNKKGDMLILEFICHDEIHKVNAAINTLREETSPLMQTEQTGLGAGPVVGIAITTFVLGAAIALLGASIIYKRQNIQVPLIQE